MILHRIITLTRLTRIPNLVIIALVLYLQRWCIVLPGLQQSGIETGWTGYGFIVLGTVLIAAGGYLVNDFFDTDIDAVNRHGKVVSPLLVSPGSLKTIYIAVTLSGLISIAYACYLSGISILWLVYLLAAVVLFWYSFRLKKALILGNLAVAIASAFTMPAAWLFDLLPLSGWDSIGFSAGNDYSGISVIVTIYCFFAFLISFAREIIKDIEDMEGDSRYGCRSLPVVYGVPVAKGVVVSGFGLTFFLLIWWQISLYSSGRPDIAAYLTIAVDLPLLWLSVYVMRMRSKGQYHNAGLMAKVIMVTGILSMLWFLI